MGSRINMTVLDVALEATVGTEITSDAAFESVPLFNVRETVDDSIEMEDVGEARDTLAAGAQQAGLSTRSITAECRLDGRTYNGAIPPWMRLMLPIAGFLQTTRGGGVAPSAPTVTQETPLGSGLTGTYLYKITTVDESNGSETQASTASSSQAPSSEMNQLTFANPGAGKLTRIYRTKTSGSTYYLVGFKLGTSGGGNQTFDDELADTALDVTSTAPGSTAVDVWVPASDNHEAATIRPYLDGTRPIGIGCRASVAWSGRAGRPIPVNFNIQGRYKATDLNQAQPASPKFAGQPPKLESAGLQLIPRSATSATGSGNGVGSAIQDLCFSELGFDSGTQIEPRECGNAAEGVTEFEINAPFGGRFTLTVEAFKGSKQWDPVADMRSHTVYCASYTVGSGEGALTQSFPNLQIVGARRVTVGTNKRGWALDFVCRDFTRNDWMRLSRAAS